MKQIIDFYKNLDVLNMIIFWGVIIVVILLLVFAIIISKKNKKLQKELNDKQNEENKDIPINTSVDTITPVSEKNITYSEETPSIIFPESPISSELIKEEPRKNIEEEKKFVVEEHVIEYNNDLFSLSNIKKATEVKEEKPQNESVQKIDNNLPRTPYQRNVLKEMSLAQTSPIGIVKKKEELPTSLNEKNITTDNLVKQDNGSSTIDKSIAKDISETSPIIKKEQPINESPKSTSSIIKEEPKLVQENSKETIKEPIKEVLPKEETKNTDYLNEVSKKLADATQSDGPDRTAYELKQEEEAIISYEELMQKKDQIKIVDEEDAVISIEELMNKQKAEKEKEEVKTEEKLYNLTDSENNDNFINELKNFRHDL